MIVCFPATKTHGINDLATNHEDLAQTQVEIAARIAQLQQLTELQRLDPTNADNSV